ncbi:FlgD immunoglobulin-like domain containing protein [Gemmobacter lanyuensis]
MLVVRNEAGDVVNRIDLAVGKTEFSWLPQDMTGAELPEGLYSFEVENYQGDMQQTSSAVELYGRVTEVRALPGGMVLMVDGDESWRLDP